MHKKDRMHRGCVHVCTYMYGVLTHLVGTEVGSETMRADLELLRAVDRLGDTL